ncbi:MAG: molybdopterin-dependent oxidoreductase, partial [Gammaproteobacteria bacterium]|nr:molybdopterin-dependent oxidoreductase [Gammaproteobacteria bacterium]NIW50160.1 molybdopterin-dependent oxidoreductase [Gammaproteobacteria bacterium]
QKVLDALKPHYEVIKTEVDEFNRTASQHSKYGNMRKGIGVAGMWYRFGKSGSLKIPSYAELRTDGSFVVFCSAPEYGQGIETVMVQLAAESLGVPQESITLVNADTLLTPDSGVQGASRATYWVGNSVVDAAQNLKNNIFAVASEMLDCHPQELQINEGTVHCTNAPENIISLAEIASEFENLGKSKSVNGLFDLSLEFPD